MKRQIEAFRLSGGGLFFAAAALLALLAFLGMYSFLRSAAPTVQVYAVRTDLPPGHEVTAGDLIARQVPESAVPDSAVREPKEAAGRRIRYGLAAGDILREVHLSDKANSQIPRKLGAMGPNYRALMLPREVVPDADRLVPGDTLEILGVVTYKDEEQSTPLLMRLGLGTVLEDQAKMTDAPGVLVAVTVEDAARVALIQRSGSVMALLQGDAANTQAVGALRLDYLATEGNLNAPQISALIEAAKQQKAPDNAVAEGKKSSAGQ
ncbi:MAG: SAF domain-containing protein [Bacillota bacterium]